MYTISQIAIFKGKTIRKHYEAADFGAHDFWTNPYGLYNNKWG